MSKDNDEPRSDSEPKNKDAELRPLTQMDTVVGTAHLRRSAWFGFPRHQLVTEQGGVVLARIGRGGWFKIYFGRGKRVAFSNGTEARLIGVENGARVAPWIVSDSGKLVTSGSDGERSYGINGRDFAYRLFRADSSGIRKSRSWMLTDHDERLATLTDREIHSHVAIPIGAVVLGFTLIRYGIPGEAKLVPANWA